jgi:hypothetical protein
MLFDSHGTPADPLAYPFRRAPLVPFRSLTAAAKPSMVLSPRGEDTMRAPV